MQLALMYEKLFLLLSHLCDHYIYLFFFESNISLLHKIYIILTRKPRESEKILIKLYTCRAKGELNK